MQTYGELIHKRIADGYCPLCHESSDHYIDHNDTAYIVPARTPYESDHIIICSKEHVELQSQLTAAQSADIHVLVDKRTKILYDRHGELVVFLRQWSVLGKTGKSIWHLHWHIVPHFTIQYGWSQANSDARVFMSDDQYHNSVQHLQSYRM